MKRQFTKIIFLKLSCLLLFLFAAWQISWGQNAIAGSGFTNGWPGACNQNTNFVYFSASAGTSFTSGALTPRGTGNQFWRLATDWGGSIYQMNNGGTTDAAVLPNTKYNLNVTCQGSGAFFRNVASTNHRYVFKTLNGATSSPTGTWVFFEIQGTTVQSVTNVSRSITNVFPGQDVTITATISGSFATGQGVYLRYSTNSFSSSTVVAMTGSNTTYTATIPASANTPGATVSYYVFTSGDSGPSSDGSDADLYTINLNNNSNANYSYTVANGWTTATSGNWGTAATWTANAVPPTTANMGTVNIDHTVTGNVDAIYTRLNINSSNTLTLNSGVTHSARGGIFINGLATYTINGNLQINGGGFVDDIAPSYSTGSTLIYNTGGIFNRAKEWPSGNTPGVVPHHVTIQAGTTLNLDVNPDPNNTFDYESRTCLGNLDLFGSLTMGGDLADDGGTMAEDFIVVGNVTIRPTGSLTLGCQKPGSDVKIGDILVGGNWLHQTGGIFRPTRRAVHFNGSNAEQTVTFSGIERFAYFVVNKPGNGIVKMFCSAYVYGTNQGSHFQLLNGRLDLNGNDFTISLRDSLNKVNGVDINLSVRIDGISGNLTREIINSSASLSTFNFTHHNNNQHLTEIVRNTPANASLLSFGSNVMVTIGSSTGNAGVNFGNTISTINGTLRINRRGYVDIYPPTYSNNSLLQYNIGDVYNRNAEWNAASGPGYPFNVQLSTVGTRLLAGGAALSGAPANTATALNMAGSLTIDAGTTFDMTNANANNMTVPLTVGLDINNDGKLWASQTAGGNIILGRSWTRTATAVDAFVHYTRSVTFNASRDATLSAPGIGETFHDLIIDKAGTGTMGTNYVGFRVTLNSPAAVANNLNLTNGYFVTTSTNLMTINAVATATDGRVETFVSGPLRKLGSADFSFPVGKITNTGGIEQFHYRPIAISNLGASADYTAQFYRANPYLQGPISTPAKNKGLQLISYCEYWDLTRVSGTNTITVTPSWSNHSVWSSKCNATDYALNASALVVVPYNGNNPIAGSAVNNWGDEDFGQNSTGTGNPSYIQKISWNAAINYNKFVLGSMNWRLAPLPFELKNFNALAKNTFVQLDWLANNNNLIQHYTIERSRDGISFETLKKVNARNNEATASYNDADPAPYNGWVYYRLRITDMSGQMQYSRIQKVWVGGNQPIIQVTPKPAKNMLWVNLSKPEEISELTIISSVGQLLFKQNRLQSNNQIDISRLEPGVYYVRLIGKSGIVTEAFVKE